MYITFSTVCYLSSAMTRWPIAIKKRISNSTRSDQPFQKLVYSIRYSQLSITFAVFDMFVCMYFFYVFECACGLSPAFGYQK